MLRSVNYEGTKRIVFDHLSLLIVLPVAVGSAQKKINRLTFYYPVESQVL